MSPEAFLTHFLAGFTGFAVGGYTAYWLIMRKMKSRVTSMFDFGDGATLIDEIAEVDEE